MGCACSYVAMASLLSSSHPILANMSACSLLLIFVWALTLCSIVVCVRDCNILIKSYSIGLHKIVKVLPFSDGRKTLQRR